MKRFCFISILVINNLFAQTGKIRGVIKSEGKAVEFANVGLVGTVYGTASNEKGFFELKDIKPGKYSLQISAIGFKRYQQNITVKDGDNLKLNVNVESSTSELNEVVITGTLKEVSIMESSVRAHRRRIHLDGRAWRRNLLSVVCLDSPECRAGRLSNPG